MKMKILFPVLLAILFVNHASAQNQTKRYCELFVHYTNTNANQSPFPVEIKLSYGIDNQPATQDTITIRKIKKVENYKTISDGLDYMNSLGWQVESLVNVGNVIRIFLSTKL
ncbi:hypothetical protein [Mucilaginibacter sp. KACC 22063]|uniref:hypothetical protein n=1 Tax=Mucilaginibacter sp. KACC 22063 TaxID=3025666 RepID=UPI00236572F1|nr:hypothetical protein [Mucilaginibacter sp. KACC 22063]WDF55814.1 hypothetical protein PQ461_01905 [Mucilaginibacter sp. KACC 22063]